MGHVSIALLCLGGTGGRRGGSPLGALAGALWLLALAVHSEQTQLLAAHHCQASRRSCKMDLQKKKKKEKKIQHVTNC